MMNRYKLIPLFLVPFLISPLQGQQPAERVVTDADIARRDMTGVGLIERAAADPAFAMPSPGDTDLGEQLILTRRERYRSLTIFGNVTEYFTTNAFLTRSNPRSDWFTAMQVGATWQPHLGGGLFGEGTARQQLFRYARFSELSFNSLDVGGGLIYVMPGLGDLSLYGRYNYNLLTNASANRALFHEQTLQFGLQKPIVFSRAHFAFVGFASDIVLEGDPGFALRDRFALYAGYQLNITRFLEAGLFYQIGYLPFRENNRHDWNQILSAGLAWRIIGDFSVNAMVSAAFNHSNDEFFDYSVLNVGAGVSGMLRF